MAATSVLIVGASGSGKSTAARTLPAEETFYINVMSKDLPYKGWKGLYKELSKDNPNGNLLNSSDSNVILQTLDFIDKKRPEIKYIVIDDNQYIAADYLMSKAKETGFGKFTEVGLMIYKIATKGKSMRSDLMIFILNHQEQDFDSNGDKYTKAKTAGKLIDNQITYEGLFTIVLFAYKTDMKGGTTEYGFTTNGDSTSTVKTPDGMFADKKIPNDLLNVAAKIREYES